MDIQNTPETKNSRPKMEMDFYEILMEVAKTRTIYLTIPETFVFNFRNESITLLCTNYESGQLIVKESIPRHILVESVKFFEDLVKMNSKYPIAVSKVSGSSKKDICTILLKKKECLNIWDRFQNIGKDQILQRYIPSGWNISLYRCTYNSTTMQCKKLLLKKINKNKYEHPALKRDIFTNPNLHSEELLLDRISYSIKRLDQVACTIVNDYPALDTKMAYLVALLEKYYNPNRSIKVASLQADWIQDPKGNLFLINVKNYKMKNWHNNFVIDRPMYFKQKNKLNYSHNEMILRRSLSPPYCLSLGHNTSAMKCNKSLTLLKKL